MTETKTPRELIADLALELLQAGVPASAIGEQFALAGVGVMIEARGREETVARLERLIENLPAASIEDPRFKQ